MCGTLPGRALDLLCRSRLHPLAQSRRRDGRLPEGARVRSQSDFPAEPRRVRRCGLRCGNRCDLHVDHVRTESRLRQGGRRNGTQTLRGKFRGSETHRAETPHDSRKRRRRDDSAQIRHLGGKFRSHGRTAFAGSHRLCEVFSDGQRRSEERGCRRLCQGQRLQAARGCRSRERGILRGRLSQRSRNRCGSRGGCGTGETAHRTAERRRRNPLPRRPDASRGKSPS